MEESYLRKRKKVYNISNLSKEEVLQFEKQIKERETDVFNNKVIVKDDFVFSGLEHITTDKILLFPKF